jgi:hypothetical protein
LTKESDEEEKKVRKRSELLGSVAEAATGLRAAPRFHIEGFPSVREPAAFVVERAPQQAEGSRFFGERSACVHRDAALHE